MLHRLYMRTLALAASPRALWWLAAVAFAESSFFPIPPDALLIPMALARPDRAWRFAAVCTVGKRRRRCARLSDRLRGFRPTRTAAASTSTATATGSRLFRTCTLRYGLWVILIKGLTPIPYKIVTIASGAAKFNFTVFMLASAVTRGARFFIVAALLRFFGTPMRDFIERRLTLVTSLFAAGLVGGFLALKLL